MGRYKLTLEYDGRGFVGWQRQDSGPSIQQALEEAITAFSGETVVPMGAGRTDAGVHALGQAAHVDLAREWPPDEIMGALNHHLQPNLIAVLSVEAVDDDFHARFSARERAYRYRIVNRRGRLALEEGRAWWIGPTLDVAAMDEAAQVLVGHHDFTSFRASHCQAKSPEKTLDELSVTRHGPEIIVVHARARSFLHHQVRNLVGTLALVGEGKWNADDVAAALAARTRTAGGPTAPAGGLYLVRVGY
jgi:tRNA pseudouridine38-40 synthase